MKYVCVFAGSNPGTNPKYEAIAIQLGEELMKRNMGLVYGGSRLGLMGRIANTMLEENGQVIGVMPKGLFREEVIHRGLTQLYEVADMHARKAKMGELSDAFIALPGGYGTLEEVFEAVSWGQLGIHHKPVGLLNIDCYYQPLIDMVNNAVKGGFIPQRQASMLIVEKDPVLLLERMKSYQAPTNLHKWSELPEAK
ncbi:LOG family protein [Rubeoparvulum massiliense]|uniref:LOG family protein n=1 Tax=Rubeoparvulum massiliense TaxID=1631346 RepID=UPI00065E4EC6|nr:TIGR00730 family Rossman fold protein [Rubeoparvulum massiliense]